MPKYAVIQSGPFAAHSATRSPGTMPRARRPCATCAMRSPSAAYEISSTPSGRNATIAVRSPRVANVATSWLRVANEGARLSATVVREGVGANGEAKIDTYAV